MRADEVLTRLGLSRSRAQAKELIQKKLVRWKNKLIEKPAEKIDFQNTSPSDFEIAQTALIQFVSRGGAKLEGALQTLNFSVKDLKIIDIGVSTGGFSDCVLQRGASLVVGIDVGTNQIDRRLLENPRFRLLEKTHIKSPRLFEMISHLTEPQFDFVVADLSFISVSHLAPVVSTMLKTRGHILVLVKPQFEVGPQGLNKSGVVKNVALYPEVEEKAKSTFKNSGFRILNYFASSIEGTDGNQEFFLFASKDI